MLRRLAVAIVPLMLVLVACADPVTPADGGLTEEKRPARASFELAGVSLANHNPNHDVDRNGDGIVCEINPGKSGAAVVIDNSAPNGGCPGIAETRVTFRFEGTGVPPYPDQNHLAIYNEGCLTVTQGINPHNNVPNQLHFIDFSSDGDAEIYNYNAGPWTFSLGGTPFTVISMDFEQPGTPNGAFFVSSAGVREELPSDIVGTHVFSTVGWSNITSFTWDQIAGILSMDNLVIRVSGSC